MNKFSPRHSSKKNLFLALFGANLVLLSSCAVLSSPLSLSPPLEHKKTSANGPEVEELQAPLIELRQEAAAVIIAWDKPYPIALYRRDVLDDLPPQSIGLVLGQSGNLQWIDTDISPDRVYAYQGRYLLFPSRLPSAGPLSEEEYIYIEK